MLLSLILFIINGCKVAEDFQIRKEFISTDKLRIDGYFYTEYETGYAGFFLFRNGIYRGIGAILKTESLKNLDKKVSEYNTNYQSYNAHWFWGVYNVEGNKILINRWLPGSGGPYPAQLLEGEILNDNKIVIAGLTENGTTNKIDTFHFRQFSPKPDSTNNFIE